MGFSFTVSALSRISFVDLDAYKRAKGIPDSEHSIIVEDFSLFERFSHKTPPNEIERWWTRTEAAHAAQLNERLRWDETSSFEQSADPSSKQSSDLDALAAFIARFGTDNLGAAFAKRPRPAYRDEEMVAWVKSRGFAVQFPQVIVDANYFLPFKANLILEVPDWRGKTARFGSLPRLLDEYDELMVILAAAGPRVAELGSVDRDGYIDDPAYDPLVGAYNAARMHRDLSGVAMRENLPKWFSE